MKKRGVLALVLATALLVVPSALESTGLDLPAMTVSASGNNTVGTGGGNSTPSTPSVPSVSGNNSYNPGNSAAGSNIPEGSSIAVNNSTPHSVIIVSSAQEVASAAGLGSGETLEATVEASYGPLSRELIDSTAARAGAEVGYVVEITMNIGGRDGFPQVTNLNSPIRIQLNTPENINGNDNDCAVIRIHNGAATVIYAAKGQLKGVKDSVPKTGDTIPAAIPVAVTVGLAAMAVDGTVIDYPVMQTMEDENYYLYRDFHGNEDKAGCLILDTDSSLYDVEGTANLIIHGHNMKAGTMFGELDAYKDENYYQEHKHMTLYTRMEKREYEVIAVFYSQVYYSTDKVFKYYDFFQAGMNRNSVNFIQILKKCRCMIPGWRQNWETSF